MARTINVLNSSSRDGAETGVFSFLSSFSRFSAFLKFLSAYALDSKG